jgi:hypothetical protein
MTVTLTQIVLYAGTVSSAISIVYSILPKVETFQKYPRFQSAYGTFLSILKQVGGNLRNVVHPEINTDGGSKVSTAAATGQNISPEPKVP